MARSFNGSNQRVSGSTPITVTSFTLACWFKSNTADDNLRGLISLNRSGNENQLHALRLRGSTGGLRVSAFSDNNSGNTQASSTAGFTPGTWYHACGVWTSATMRAAYLNGTNKGIDTTNKTPSTPQEINIGVIRDLGGLQFWFNGLIACPAVWNAALNDNEVLALGLGFSPDQIRPQSLVSYQLFEPRILDATGRTWVNTGSSDSIDHPPMR